MTSSIWIDQDLRQRDQAHHRHDRVAALQAISFKTNQGRHAQVIDRDNPRLDRGSGQPIAPVQFDRQPQGIGLRGDRLAIDTLPDIVRRVSVRQRIVQRDTDRRAPHTCHVMERDTGDDTRTGGGDGHVTETTGGDGQPPPPSQAGSSQDLPSPCTMTTAPRFTTKATRFTKTTSQSRLRKNMPLRHKRLLSKFPR